MGFQLPTWEEDPQPNCASLKNHWTQWFAKEMAREEEEEAKSAETPEDGAGFDILQELIHDTLWHSKIAMDMGNFVDVLPFEHAIVHPFPSYLRLPTGSEILKLQMVQVRTQWAKWEGLKCKKMGVKTYTARTTYHQGEIL